MAVRIVKQAGFSGDDRPGNSPESQGGRRGGGRLLETGHFNPFVHISGKEARTAKTAHCQGIDIHEVTVKKTEEECMMKSLAKTLAWSLLFLGSAAICIAQEFPPTLDHNKGPFPTGMEAVRNDSPVDATDPSPSGVIHEYTAYQGTPVVDGDVTDAVWNRIPWTPMEWHISFPNTANTGDIYDSGYTPENWDGWDDITAWFKVLWDENNIYVATRKVDDNANYLEGTDTAPENIWQNDAFQIKVDARSAGEFDEVAPGSEIGFCMVEGQEVYNWWSGALASDRQLELADGDNTTGSESCLGKAIIGKQEDTATGFLETMEMAFIRWPEVISDVAQMFSIMVLDRDYDVRDCGFQWAQGIYVKTQDKYGSIVWSSKTAPETGVEDKAAGIPETFALQQNFPNPFNPSTTISYRLLRPGQVKMDVFDISGRLVSPLVDEKQSAGYHSVTFDAKGLNTGTYLCRLKTGSSTAVRKMLFVK
jgi:hypothetical protein